MFNINNISDKYSSLYLNDDIKDQFFSLLLIGLDNKYMDVDAETLNNTTQHYKDKLNIRFKEVFNKNFNLKSKDHLGLLSDTLGVNFTFKNLNTNKNRNTFKVYNKTLYFLNDGNEYGLVLKNNKKSLQGGLAESSLKAFEKLNLEGGVRKDVYLMEGGPDDNPRQNDRQQALSSPPASQQPATPPGSPTLSATSVVTATTGKGESQSQLSSPSSSPSSSPARQLSLQLSPQVSPLKQKRRTPNTTNTPGITRQYRRLSPVRRRNAAYETKKLQEEWEERKNLCLDNCLVNEASTYYTDTILTEMNAEIEKDITAWNNLANDGYNNNIFEFITNTMADRMEYFKFRNEYENFSTEKLRELYNSITHYAHSRKMGTIVDNNYTIDQRNILSKRYKDLYSSYEKINSLSSAPSSVDIISEFNTKIGANNNILPELQDNVKFNVKMNLLNLSYSSNKGDWDIISQNDEEWIDKDNARKNWSEERKNGWEEDIISQNDEERKNGWEEDIISQNDEERKNGLGEDIISKNDEEWIDKDGADILEGGTQFKLNPLNQGQTSNITSNAYYKSIIDNYSIIDLLERGIDSQHDFGSQIKDNNTTTLNTKRELFEAFNPDKIDDGFTYSDYNEFIISLAVLVYDSFNKIIIKNIKYSKNYQIKSGLSIPFEPRLTKRVEIDKKHNPFAHKGWEKNSKLYYIAGNTIQYNPSNQMNVNTGYTGVNLFDRVKTNSKKIIIFQDSQGSSDVIFSFFNNIDMRPGSFYQSFDNYIRTLKTLAQKKAFITKLNKVKADLVVTLKNFDNDDTKESLFNILKAQELQNFNTGLISTGDKSWFMKTPATALDGAGSPYLVKSEFEKNLDEINIDCLLYTPIPQPPPAPKLPNTNINRLRLEEIWEYKNPVPGFVSTAIPNLNSFNVDYSGIPAFVGPLPDANLQSLHRLICMNTNTSTKINILDETYQRHFGKICNSKSRKSLGGGISNPFGLENIHDIKFEVVLGEYEDLKDGNYEMQLWPVLLMSHYKIDSSNNTVKKTNKKYDMVIRSVSLQNLTVINNISNVLNIVYAKFNLGLKKALNTEVVNKNIDIGYQIIYNNIVDWAKNSVIAVNGQTSKWKNSHINHVFIRILYTLKMIGDHGQVKFIKALKKNVKDFNTHFEVLFTTGDSLASLYACLHNVTNTSTVVTDFPSESYCVSKPKGMIYYPST